MADPQQRLRLASALGVTTPFPWQIALLDRFLAGDVPAALDIPTGLGKTAVMAIWLVARAAGAPVPRRLVYVVDRRAVVDQASSVAIALRERVDLDPRLREDLELDGPLPISTLRGQFIDNKEWLADPSACAIVLGTVDMIGSRLLFEGYSVSRRMRPYHAGLLGNDVLLVLDESHLVRPFERLVESVAARRNVGPREFDGAGHASLAFDVPRMHLLSLSATGDANPFAHTLGADDLADDVVAERMRARKDVVVREAVTSRELPQRLADEAWPLTVEGGDARRCIIFCNGREDAQKVHDSLRARANKELAGGADVELFVGARRVWERGEAHRWLNEHGYLAGSSPPSRPTFVVATSAGEVGVDLDADDMVCDLVAWERMIQRLGRVNRRGRGVARVVVVPTEGGTDDLAARRDSVREVIAQLPEAFGGRDASPGALVSLKRRCETDEQLRALVAGASTSPPLHPPLTRAVVESWSMTSAPRHPGRPEVQPWLRGWVDDEPQTALVWRSHLPVTDDASELDARDMEAFFECAGPQLAERLEAETSHVIEWLVARLATATRRDRRPSEPSDDGPEDTSASDTTPVQPADVIAVVVPKHGEAPQRIRAWEITNKDRRDRVERELWGAVVIVHARLGGLSSSGLLDEAADEPALDLTAATAPRALGIRVRRIQAVDDNELLETEENNLAWRLEARIAVRHADDGRELAWLVLESDASKAAESEEGRTVAPKRAQLLEEHEQWAEDAARRIAERVQLPREYAGMLALAARLHDEGKRSRRWQRAFGRSRAEEQAGTVYAKTTRRPNVHLLEGYRHELGSLPYAERDPRVQDLSPELRDLCLHLIAAHHGNARPFLRTDGAEDPPSALDDRARQIALRFCLLQERWDPWRLAWWEALLRAADQQASRRNDAEGE